MPITYTIDHDRQLITEVWTGEIQASDLAEHWKRCILGCLEVLAIRRTIADVRQAVILFNGSDMNYLIQTLVLPILAGKDWKTAIVIEKPLQLGMSRQYQVFAERYSKDVIFYTMEEAQNWFHNLDSEKS